MDLLTATPVQIDTVFAQLWERQHDLGTELMMNADRLMGTAKLHYRGEAISRFSDTTEGTLEMALEIAAEQAKNTFYGGAYAAKLLATRTELLAALETNKAEQAPLFAEFERRGGWSRAYLVLNNNGHVHSSTWCSTTFPTTRFGWLVELSGSAEADIVAAIGSDACTVCYPSAPVQARPRTVFHHSEIAEQEARAARQAEKDERAAKKAAKAIANPDGSPLEVFDWRVPERQIQQRDGSVKVVEAYDRFETITTLAAAKMWLTDSFAGYTRREADIQTVAKAVAHKLDTTPEVQVAAAMQRASKRR